MHFLCLFVIVIILLFICLFAKEKAWSSMGEEHLGGDEGGELESEYTGWIFN